MTASMTVTSPRTRRRRAICFALASFVAASSGAAAGGISTAGAAGPSTRAAPAAAEKSTPEAERRARRLYQDAEAHFRAGLFAEALGEYQAGYEAAALPGFLINIAQCQRRLGDLSRARATYRQFILVAPDSPFVPQVRSLVAELDKLAEDLDGDRDGEPSAPARSTSSPRIQPTIPRQGVAGAPAAASADPRTKPGAATSLSLGAADRAAGADPTVLPGPSVPPPPKRTSRWWWLGGAIGVAAIVAGTATVWALRPADTTMVHDGTLGTLRR
jgi:hypothetical protein